MNLKELLLIIPVVLLLMPLFSRSATFTYAKQTIKQYVSPILITLYFLLYNHGLNLARFTHNYMSGKDQLTINKEI
ncbi:MAG TPA: hypothetical protein VFF27_07875 [Bacteroidia bacterium]|nr:hypothetical protein [Bacteroidia bacterium]